MLKWNGILADSMSLTDQQRQKLITAALGARQHAYCRYSSFAVGAALLTSAGGILAGCNVENASYGLSICAERNAIAAAVAAGMKPGELVAIALIADAEEPPAPCGACRQVIAEFAAENCAVICVNLQNKVKEYSLEQLLPDAFQL